MIYADTSALAKLFTNEAESVCLRAWLHERPDDAVTTSVVGEVELRRFAARVVPLSLHQVDAFLALMDRLPLTAVTVALAGQLGPSRLRTLDALHVASAAGLANLTALVSYDHRMLEAAAGYGLPVASPA